jgi:hypothetical protein
MRSYSFAIGPAIVPTNHNAVNKDRPLTCYILLYIELNGRGARFIGEDDIYSYSENGNIAPAPWVPYTRAGCDFGAVATPYANANQANHAPHEHLELERFYKGIRTGVALLANLGAHGRS